MAEYEIKDGVGIIPEGTTSLSEIAFLNCTELKSIVIPDTVTEISKWLGSPKPIYGAFRGCTGLTSIVIPDSVTLLNKNTFNGCTGLINVVIGKSVSAIERGTFSGCTGLTSIVIPDSVTEIKANAFKNCISLKNIFIPDSVTKIEHGAFAGCSGLTKIVVDEGNKTYDSRDNCNAIIETETNTLIAGCKNTVIPDSVSSLGAGAFHDCTGLTSITIPNNVAQIGSCERYYVRDNILYDVEAEFCQPFTGCVNLESIVVSEGNKVFDSRNSCNAIIRTDKNRLLAGCQGTVIPDSVTEIGGNAFDSCTSLTSIIIPDSVTGIGFDAFRGSGLTNITIPDSVTEIGSSVFKDCTDLTSVTFPNTVKKIGWCAFKGCTGLTCIIIPDSLTEISEEAFFGCTGLTSITIPDSVTKIGEGAFNGCTSLTSIVVSEGNTRYDSRNNCNAIIETETNTLIAGCKSTIIPDSVTEIGDGAFYACRELISITIPNSVMKIGEYAFGDCRGLKSVSILAPVKNISYIFGGCSALETITLCSGIKELSFGYLPSLKVINVPAKKTDYYKKRLPEELHHLIVELPPEKKSKM